MATSSKFNPSTSTPDRPSYTNGQRGSYAPASMERSGSFRESLENPVLSSLPNMSRSGSAVTQADVMSFFQCLRFDPKLLVAEFKSNRHVDYRRHVGNAMGISPDNSPSSTKGKLPPSPSLEELKRVRAALRENSIKARERIKLFNEGLSVVNKFLPTKKRSRSDVYSNERSTSFLSGNRSVQSSNLGKMATQSQAPTIACELEQQKLEEQTKASVPNKRTRTSMVDSRIDGRSNSVVRTSGSVDRLAKTIGNQGEDRSLPISGDGWEKLKMKKKRSIVKADISSSALPTKSVDGYRRPKQRLQQRSTSEVRSRLHGDPVTLRSEISGGAVGKSDWGSQQGGLAMESSTCRTDSDSNSLLSDKKDCQVSERERLNMKALNKTSIRRNDFNLASPLSNSKMKASIRAPRSGSGAAPKLSPIVHRATVPNDWELSHCSTKPGTAIAPYNRKRTASTQSSSPPVAQWAGQRPQKISRSARRTNFGPIVSNNDDKPISDSVSEVLGNEAGLGSTRRLPGSSPPVKLKVDPFSFTESEESGAADSKFREKGRKVTDDMDDKSVQNIQKMSNLMLPSIKNKLASGEDHKDGVQGQGRTGRGFSNTRSQSPLGEKVGNVANVKQLRSAKLGFDNTESKTGRPPTRKLSDRKAHSRQRQATTAVVEFMGDGQGELLAAVHAVINSMHAFPNKFWQQMEPIFGFISDMDIKYFKQQGNYNFVAPIPNPVHMDANYFGAKPNRIGSDGCEEEIDLSPETSIAGLSPEQLLMSEIAEENGIPLCQRLMAALISEDDYADYCSTGKEDTISDSLCSSYKLGGEVESDGLNHQSPINSQISRYATLNGHMMSEAGSSEMSTLNTGNNNTDFCYPSNVLFSDQVLLPIISCSESEYSKMTINERLLLEIQSVGIYPDISLVDERTEVVGISEDICTLEKLQRKGSRTKVVLQKLLRFALETKEIQEKKFEQHSLDKLVEMAYLKYMSCHRANASGSRVTINKAAKKAALAFAKWTLDHCHKYEDTGESCFNEPLYREVFIAGCSHHNAGPTSTGATAEGESVKQLACNVKLSASQSPSMASQLPENVEFYDANSADMLFPVSYSSDQSTPKEDTWSNRVKRRELLLDDVVGSTVGTHSGGASRVGISSVGSTKGKRSDRDRDGKGHGREGILRNGTAKKGRPTLSNAKGERKSKAKLKQKTTQLSVSGNSLLGNAPDELKPGLNSASNSSKMASNNNSKEKTEFGLEDPLDFSQLQFPEMDDQGQDLGSWLNSIDDDNLQDQDFMGLEIPMDDLSDLSMLY